MKHPGTRFAHGALACLASAVICHAQGIITTVAGSDTVYPGSSYSALSASFGRLSSVAVSPVTGDVYFASGSRSLIVKFNPQLNSVSVIAGIGIGGYSGDGGPAAKAALNSPQQIAFDQTGNLYIADSQNACIRKIDLQGVITTVVTYNRTQPSGLAFAPDGTIYFSDGNEQIFHVSASGTISVVAGGSQPGFAGDGGPATNALLYLPQNLAFDTAGNLYVADTGNQRIRRIGTDGIISTIAGNGQAGPLLKGPAVATPIGFILALAFDAAGNLYSGTYDNLVRIDSNGSLSILNPSNSIYPLTTPTPLTNADVGVSGLAFDRAGNLYLTDQFANCLYRSSLAGTIQAVAGYAPNFGIGDNGPALSAGLNGPQMLGFLSDGSLLIADEFNQRIRSLSTTGEITTIAGTGSPAVLFNPVQAIAGSAGNIDIATLSVEQVSPSGTISIIGPGAISLAFDLQGNLLLTTNQDVQKISPAGQITALAGNSQQGFSGDGGPAISASLNSPHGLALDSKGNVYIADSGNGRVRKVATGGVISTFAGGGNLTLDGVAATQSFLGYPFALAVDQADNLYVTDPYFNLVKKISVDGIISTFAGTGSPGFSGDGGPATAATLNRVDGVAVDAAGNVYISDTLNNRIREVLASPPTIAVSSSQINVSAFSNGAPTQASVTVTSSVQGLGYLVAFSTASGGDWLGLSSLQGRATGVLPITVDPSSLQPGTYQGTITLNSPDATPQVLPISVTLNVVQAQPAVLALSAQSLAFALTTNSNPSSTQLTVSNQGSGAIRFIASTNTVTGGAWLQVSQQSGTVGPASPANLTVTANPGTLAPGSYSGTITVASPDTGQQITVPVTLAISPTPQKILLSQTGLTFTAVAQGGAPIPQSVGILNTGSGSMTWTATANTLSGSGWLSLSETTGTVTTPFLDVSFVNVNVNPASLAAGTYYGNVQVTAPGASNSPQTVLVVLDVLPPGSNPGPQLSPTGLVFTGVAGAVNPGSQSVSVANVTANATAFGSSVTYVGTPNWISYLPQNGTVQPGTPAQILAQPNFANLSLGVLRAALTLAFDDGSIRTVSILSVVAPTGTSEQAARHSGAPNRPLPRASGCTPSKLSPVFTQLGTGTTVPAGWPAPIVVKVVDDCGNPQTSGSVVATFSNGDPALPLIDLQDGAWSGTWVPHTASSTGVTVSVTAELQQLNLSGAIQTTIGLLGNQVLPLLTSQPVSAATLAAGPLAPGELVVINGSALAHGQASSTSSPLPQQLAGASVLIGGQLTSLLYANNGQLVGIVPPNIPVNSSQQIVPLRDNTIGVPTAAIVAATQPAVFTREGSGTGQALAYKAGVLADTSNPVQSGDTVIIYTAGLGVVDAAGAATNPVSATIGGQAAQIGYAGTAVTGSFPAAGPPQVLGVSTGLGGLYQVTATIPAGVSGGPAAVIFSSAGQTSQQGVTLAIAGSATGSVPAITSTVTAGGFPDIAQNDWIQINGTNLAPASVGPNGMTWNDAPDFALGKMPAQLAGVSVTVNGKPAFVYFVSGTQVNVLSPLDSSIGPVQIVVTNGGTPSAPFTANMRSAAPSFPFFGTNYVAATHLDYSLLGPTSLGSAFTPASPGETVVLYAFGFGLPATALSNGSSTQSGTLPVLPSIQIGGAPAQVSFAGVISPGLYQFNVTIPTAAANGDNAVICTYGGLTTPAGDVIAVQAGSGGQNLPSSTRAAVSSTTR